MIQQNKELKDRIRYGSTNLVYYIKRSKRIKTSELIVDSDRIEIRTPLNKTVKDTRDIVRDKAEWILRKQEQLKSSILEIIKPTFEEGSTLPYLGKNYTLRINKNQARRSLNFVDDEFVINIPSVKMDEDARSQIKNLYEQWIIGEAYSNLKPKVENYSRKLEVHVQQILVTNNLRSRWASLTKKGSINFNMHLLKAPQDVVDYIVLHEICHLNIKGHSHHCWDLVYRYMPNYKERIDWLNLNGKSLII